MCVTLEVVSNNDKVVIEKNNDTIADILDKKYELSLLFDYYGNLLKENHKVIFEEYVLDDMSLSEIANEHGITRQGVHDSIKRSTKHLTEYENCLRLISKGRKLTEYVNHLRKIINKDSNNIISEEDRKEADMLLDNISREV